MYQGMRWLKCDLQVQTPEDGKHWLDQGLKLLEPRRPKKDGQPDESDIQEKARKFLRRCHELELDLIALTDHNFSSKDDPRDWFSVHLVEQNKTVAKEYGRLPLVILPGFEVDIGYHVLCMFKPAKKQRDFERCNGILTKLGLAAESRFDQAGPKQLRHNEQRVSLKKLIEIVQDEHDGIVIAAHADQKRGIFDDASNRDDYSNTALYCVELTQNPPSSKHQNILSGNDPAWTRKYSHPAWIMSSDAKSLRSEQGSPIANSLGYRYSWIKMSEPSIESLRQAFLDHESRIMLPGDTSADVPPYQRERKAQIHSIAIKSVAFLADQEVHFSPDLNCVIGGRGSGKSTLLEYLRILLGKDKEADLDRGTEERIRRVRETLDHPGTEVEVCWISAEGVEDRLVWRSGESVLKEHTPVDLKTFFESLSVRFYSQQQLNRLTETSAEEGQVRRAQRLLELIDGFAEEELEELGKQARRLVLEIHEKFSKRRQVVGLNKELKKMQQELQELERQWKARSEIQEVAKRHEQLKSESRYMEGIWGYPGKQFSDVANLAKEIAASHAELPSMETPNSNWLSQFDSRLKEAKNELARSIEDAVNAFESAVNAMKADDPFWSEIDQAHQQADEKFRAACAEKGLSPEDVGRMQEINQSRARKQREIDRLEADMVRLAGEVGDVELRMEELHKIWKKEFHKREEAAVRANTIAVLNEERSKFIEVKASYQQDDKSFIVLWKNFSPSDGRTALGRRWEELGKKLFSYFVEVESQSPWEAVRQLLQFSDETEANAVLDNCAAMLKEHIRDNIESWEKLRCSRVADTVDMTLYRSDGSVAGSISDGSLSDGQRNTAALALLLAQDGGPLVIDQPEDELDSNFVFRELIPMLRRVKSKRQIIMATHNANLPVNGDAELVYAFQAVNGKGEPLACGGLDRERVTKSVLDIMEGTEEAFRRRREKYHF